MGTLIRSMKLSDKEKNIFGRGAMRSTEVKPTYRVKSLYEASFLCYRGFNLLSKEPLVGEKGKWFLIFEETDELRNAVQEFYGNKNIM